MATASIPAYFDNAADGGNNGGTTTSLTYSYTVGTNSNRLLLVNLVGDYVSRRYLIRDIRRRADDSYYKGPDAGRQMALSILPVGASLWN